MPLQQTARRPSQTGQPIKRQRPTGRPKKPVAAKTSVGPNAQSFSEAAAVKPYTGLPPSGSFAGHTQQPGYWDQVRGGAVSGPIMRGYDIMKDFISSGINAVGEDYRRAFTEPGYGVPQQQQPQVGLGETFTQGPRAIADDYMSVLGLPSAKTLNTPIAELQQRPGAIATAASSAQQYPIAQLPQQVGAQPPNQMQALPQYMGVEPSTSLQPAQQSGTPLADDYLRSVGIVSQGGKNYDLRNPESRRLYDMQSSDAAALGINQPPIQGETADSRWMRETGGRRNVVRLPGGGVRVHPMEPAHGATAPEWVDPRNPMTTEEAQDALLGIRPGLMRTPQGTIAPSHIASLIGEGETGREAAHRLRQGGMLNEKHRRKGQLAYKAGESPRQTDAEMLGLGMLGIGGDGTIPVSTDAEALGIPSGRNSDYQSQLQERRARVVENAQARATARRQRLEQRNAPQNPMTMMMQQNPELAMQYMMMQQRGQSDAAALGLQREEMQQRGQLGNEQMNLDRDRLAFEQKQQSGEFSPSESAMVADWLDARERGEMSSEEFEQRVRGLKSGGQIAQGAAPNGLTGGQRSFYGVPGFSQQDQNYIDSVKETPTGPEDIRNYARSKGMDDVAIGKLLNDVYGYGSVFRSAEDPYGTTNWWLGGGPVLGALELSPANWYGRPYARGVRGLQEWLGIGY